jgi:hypothetical protein
MDTEGLKTFLYGFSSVARFLLGSSLGRLALIGGITLLFALKVWGALRSRALACGAAGTRLGWGEGFLILFKEFYASVLALGAALPAIAAALLASLALVAVSDSLKSMDELRANAARIRELSVVLKNLERRQKVMDLRVLSVKDGVSTIFIEYYDPADEAKPAASEELSLPGSDIYLDAIVFNFDYSEIAEGRRVNLALPYRVFSDRLPQAQGLPLRSRDADGLPYAYGRDESELYGIAPAAYRERLAQLMALLDDERGSREAGIVRSVYGSAVHRRARAGERFSVWIEQSGGITVKDAVEF